MRFRAESVELHALPEPSVDAMVWEREGRLGGAPLLPGGCFDPDQWQPYSAADLAHPVTGVRLEQAWEKLKRGA